MKKILILGSSGSLGNKLYKELKKIKGAKLFHTGLKKRKIDIFQKKSFSNYISYINPDLIINCVAYVNIEKCEKHKSISYKINYELLIDIFLIKKQKSLKFKLIHFSTDQFYNQKLFKLNNEKSKINLLNNYSIHKRMAELECIKNQSLIFRINFFGKTRNNKTFSDWIFNNFKNKKKKTVYLFKDVYFNPLTITSISKIISSIIIDEKYSYKGIYNLGSKNFISKSDFAVIFKTKLGLSNKNYQLINVNDLMKVKRPNNMSMDVEKFEKKFNIKLPLIEKEINEELKNYI